MVVVLEESCDLELQLTLGRTADVSLAESTSSSSGSVINGSFGNSQQQQHRKKLTMFYDGQICVCDVTELQANAILSMARTEIDGTMPNNSPHHQRSAQQSRPPATAAPPTSPQAVEQLRQPGLSMKRSLQRFLQKRKSRIGDVSPYAHRKQQLLLFPINS